MGRHGRSRLSRYASRLEAALFKVCPPLCTARANGLERMNASGASARKAVIRLGFGVGVVPRPAVSVPFETLSRARRYVTRAAHVT